MTNEERNAIELLKREERRGFIKVHIDTKTAEIFVSSLYTDYFISFNKEGYKLTHYHYKWDDESDQMESWPYEEGVRVAPSLTELAELIIDDLRD